MARPGHCQSLKSIWPHCLRSTDRGLQIQQSLHTLQGDVQAKQPIQHPNGL